MVLLICDHDTHRSMLLTNQIGTWILAAGCDKCLKTKGKRRRRPRCAGRRLLGPRIGWGFDTRTQDGVDPLGFHEIRVVQIVEAALRFVAPVMETAARRFVVALVWFVCARVDHNGVERLSL